MSETLVLEVNLKSADNIPDICKLTVKHPNSFYVHAFQVYLLLVRDA